MRKTKYIHEYVLAVFLLCSSFVFLQAVQVQITPSNYSKCWKILSKTSNNNSKNNFESSGFSHDSFIFEAEEVEEVEENENTEDSDTQKAKSISYQFLFCCKKSVINLAERSKYRNKIFLSYNNCHSQLKNVKLLL